MQTKVAAALLPTPTSTPDQGLDPASQ